MNTPLLEYWQGFADGIWATSLFFLVALFVKIWGNSRNPKYNYQTVISDFVGQPPEEFKRQAEAMYKAQERDMARYRGMRLNYFGGSPILHRELRLNESKFPRSNHLPRGGHRGQ